MIFNQELEHGLKGALECTTKTRTNDQLVDSMCFLV